MEGDAGGHENLSQTCPTPRAVSSFFVARLGCQSAVAGIIEIIVFAFGDSAALEGKTAENSVMLRAAFLPHACSCCSAQNMRKKLRVDSHSPKHVKLSKYLVT